MKATMQKTMQAAVIDHFGGLDTLKVREIPVPEICNSSRIRLSKDFYIQQ